MDFVLALHSHIPWVLNHGRWPHGSDWLCEAALDAYLPLLQQLETLAAVRIPAPLTLGITPVLASQLASPVFHAELEHYFAGRLDACARAESTLAGTGEAALIPIVGHYRERLAGLRERFHASPDLARAFGQLAERGRLELMSSAATHGLLPLLSRDESIRLQLLLGRSEHERIFGRRPRGLWLPECAYRPAGRWAPLAMRRPEWRAGLEQLIAESGYEYCFVDAHLARAGAAFGGYGHEVADREPAPAPNSPYRAYRVAGGAGRPIAVLPRDPVATRQVWSRHLGYPGDRWYREFHKIRWPEGLRLWRVSAPGSGLGEKHPYQPARAQEQVRVHARHFATLLRGLAPEANGGDSVLAVPFDTELFGHWWFEGAEFVGELFRALVNESRVRPATAGDHLDRHPPTTEVELLPGSWGAEGDFRMWLNPGTEWTWARLWSLEALFWRVAPEALGNARLRPILAQAAREMLLAMASDWTFIISTGDAADYGVRRLVQHCADAESLLAALLPGGPSQRAAEQRAAELWQRDSVFPEVLATVAEVLGTAGRRAGGQADRL